MSAPVSVAVSRRQPVPVLSPRMLFWVEFALALGGFGIGTGEFVIMGLMPQVAAEFAVPETGVGHLISAYALGVVIGSPLLAILGARLPRRRLLLILMVCYAVGNIASALASSFYGLMLFRFLAGFPHGTYFGVAALLAASLVPEEHRARAVSHVLVGLTVALLLGNPLATWLGQIINWRWAFVLVGGISVATVLMILALVPKQDDAEMRNPLDELRAFNQPDVWLALLVGATGFAGLFCVFSYVAPTIEAITRVDKVWIPIAMAMFGGGAIVGNLIGGWLYDRLRFDAVGVLLLWSLLVLLVYPSTTHNLLAMLTLCFCIGTMIAMSPAIQTHLMSVADGAQTLAAASNHAAFNLANALGPWLGGMVMAAGYGWQSTGYTGAAMAVVGLLVYGLARRRLPDAQLALKHLK
jgi:MFS transporter, DHA1 family, inner membrane transport protein